MWKHPCIDGVATRSVRAPFRVFVDMRADIHMCIAICDGYRDRAEFVFQASDVDISHLGSYGHSLICGIAQIARMRLFFSLLYIHLYTAVEPITLRNPCRNPSNETKMANGQ